MEIEPLDQFIAEMEQCRAEAISVLGKSPTKYEQGMLDVWDIVYRQTTILKIRMDRWLATQLDMAQESQTQNLNTATTTKE